MDSVTAARRFDVVPTQLAVEAMRDNGYKNAAYAIAELIDNSIQAGASHVQLICTESEEQLSQRRRVRLQQIGVLDDGCGMDADVLRMALQFGNGTRLQDRTGMGRFGMGLPSASISQCLRVDVWSWQAGVENALHSFIDIDMIKRGEQHEVPEPTAEPIPRSWRHMAGEFGQSGTLVVWKSLDRCMWKRATTVIDNSEFIIGRMYRKFIDDGSVDIRLAAYNVADYSTPELEKLALPNDPLFLMAGTQAPAPYDDEPMFQPFTEDWELPFEVSHDGQRGTVVVRFSYAKEEVRAKDQAGSTAHGKHAARNLGVSVVRARRELELDPSWTNTYDPTERWWGCEVEFPPELDELFGVTNNKQSARNFNEVAKMDVERLAPNGDVRKAMAELAEDGDPTAPLLEIAYYIENNLTPLRNLLTAQTRSQRANRRHDSDAETRATEATQKRKEDGYVGASDADETLSPDQRTSAIERELIEEGLPAEEARRRATTAISAGLKYVFAEADLQSHAFFSVRPRGGAIVVTLNTTHPAYDRLVEVLDTGAGDDDTSTTERLHNALEALKLLLGAWARYEDEEPEGPRKDSAMDARNAWGRVAKQFLSQPG